MNRTENKIVNAIASLLVSGDYQFRTAKAIAEKAGVSQTEVINVATDYGFNTDKTRRRDNAALVGFGGNSLRETEILASLSAALMDTRYTLRTLHNAVPEFDEDDAYAVADDFNYDLSKKKRDGTQLVGLRG